MRVAILGGTGKEGSGLALRWARRKEVVIGSRQREKAERVAGEINEKLGEDLVRGLPNLDAAREAEVAVLTVPYSAHEATLAPLGEALQGKPLIDTTVPLDPENPTRLRTHSGRSAAEEAQEILGPETHVVAAFQTISFTLLQNLDRPGGGRRPGMQRFQGRHGGGPLPREAVRIPRPRRRAAPERPGGRGPHPHAHPHQPESPG